MMRRKRLSTLLILSVILILLVVFVGVLGACNHDKDKVTKVIFTVNESVYETIETVSGDIVSPIAPNVDEYRFKGWYFESEGKTKFSLDGLKSRLNGVAVYVYAVYEKIPESLYIIFDVDGKEYYRSKIDSNNGIVMPTENPSKSGYDFIGWYKDKDGKESFEIEDFIADDVKDNLTLYGKFKEVEYKITYTVGDSIHEESIYTVETLSKLSLPSEPKRSGYIFCGWEDDNGNKFEISNYISQCFLKNIKVSAIFEAINYKIKLYNDSTLIKTINIFGNEKLNLESLDNKVGYNFAGWYCDEEREKLFDIDKYNVDIDARDDIIMLYAKFIENVTTVTFVDGEAEIRKVTVGGDCFLVMPESVGKKGHQFVCWYYIDEDGETAVFNADEYRLSISRKDICVYAKYEEITTEITFMISGKIYQKLNVGISEISVSELPNPTEIIGKDGYDFLGWYLDEECEKPFDIEEYQNNDRRRDISVYSKLREKEYRIAYIINRKEYIVEVVKHSEEFSPLEEVNIDGYNLLDWYLDDSFEEKFVREEFNSNKRDIQLHGKLEEKKYDITFIVGNEEFSKGYYLHFDDEINMPIAPQIIGKNFLYWSRDGVNEFDENEFLLDGERMPLVLYAVYSDIYTKIIFNINGNVFCEISLKYEEKLENLPVALSITGFDFIAWSLSATELRIFDKEEFNSSTERVDIILYAMYEEKKYTVEFYLDEALLGKQEYTYSDNNIILIVPPEIKGKKFAYWSYDEDGLSRFELNEYMSLSERYSIILYAQYEDIYVKVSFYIDDMKHSEIETRYGCEFTFPILNRDGYIFVGWYYDKSFCKVFDMTHFVEAPSDITIYAYFKKDMLGQQGEYAVSGYILNYEVISDSAVKILNVGETQGVAENLYETLSIPSKILIDDGTYNIEKICEYSIASLTHLKTLSIESGVNELETFSISDCNSLENIYLPSTLKKVATMIFFGIPKDITISIDSSEESIVAWNEKWNVDGATGERIKVEYASKSFQSIIVWKVLMF